MPFSANTAKAIAIDSTNPISTDWLNIALIATSKQR